MFNFCGKFCSAQEVKNEIKFETIVPKGVYQPDERKIYSSLDDIEDGLKVQKIVKSQYQMLTHKYSTSNLTYKDPDFPPNNKSLGNFVPLQGRKVQWKRIQDIIPNSKLLQYVTPHQACQAHPGDCYFVSTIASLAQNQARIKFLFGELEINSKGLYMIRVNVRGVQKQIVIDDYFPVYQHNNQLVYSKPIEGEDIWLMLLQKVWAKINGSYSNISFGYPHQVLTTFSNAPCFYLKIDSIQDKNSIWDCIKEAKRENYPLCCSSKDLSNSNVQITRLATYSISDCFQAYVDGQEHRVLAIRNPYQQNQYKGRYSENDTYFWKKYKNSQINNNFIEPHKEGIFTIGFDDFCKYFQSLDISHIYSYYNYNFEEVVTNSQHGAYFKVQIKQPTECYFIVQQERRPQNYKNGEEISFSRMTLAIGRWSDQNQHYQYIDSKLQNYFPTLPARCLILEPGNYMVYCKCQWKDKLNNSLTFATYSSKKINILHSQKDQRLIPEIFIDYAYTKGKRTYLDDKSWVSLELLYTQGGYAYIFARVEEGSNKKILLQFNKEQFQKSGFRIKYPKGNYNRLIAKANQTQIIVCRVIQNAQELVFPPPVKISQSL